MDQIFDRLGNLLKSFVRDDTDAFSDPRKASFSDPDLEDAWNELDDYLKTGEETPSAGDRPKATAPSPVPPKIKKDYEILDVPIGTPLADVAKSYKQLLRKHHPDRHASDPAAFAKATERTKLLTSSFRRIRHYSETGKVD